MLRVELENYLLDMGYTEEKKSSFTKKYDFYDEEETQDNKLTIEYKFNKQVVQVFYHLLNRKEKRFKGRLSSMSINDEGNIIGMKSLAE